MHPLHKVCARCGHEVPIARFVKMSGLDTYSEVCADTSTCNFLKEEMAKSSVHPFDVNAKPGEAGFGGDKRRK